MVEQKNMEKADWVKELNSLFANLGEACKTEFRVENEEIFGTVNLFDSGELIGIHDWPLPFLEAHEPDRIRAFASAAAENLRVDVGRVGDGLTMEDILNPSILARSGLSTQSEFLSAFKDEWAKSDWIWSPK